MRRPARAVADDLAALAPALREGCIGQLPEIYDGGAPGVSRGCFCPGLERGRGAARVRGAGTPASRRLCRDLGAGTVKRRVFT